MTAATAQITDTVRYLPAPSDDPDWPFDCAIDIHTGKTVVGDAGECNAHWRRQVARIGSVDAALAAYDKAVAR